MSSLPLSPLVIELPGGPFDGRPSASATVGDRLGGDERPMDVHRHRAGANVACFSSGNRKRTRVHGTA